MNTAKYFLITLFSLISGCLNGAKIAVYNHAKRPIALHVYVDYARDERKILAPLEHYKLDRLIGSVTGISITPDISKDAGGKYFDVKDGATISYDTDSQGNPILVPNKFGNPKPISFIAVSDLNMIGVTEKEMQDWEKQRIKDGKEVEESYRNSLPGHKELSSRIQNFIKKNDKENIRAVVIPGDLVWWNDNPKVEFNAFKKIYYDPIFDLFKITGGKLMFCAGNHDQYGGHNTPIMNFIKDTYGSFFYSFNANGVHFVVLGHYPSPDPKELGILGYLPQIIDRDGGSLNFLEKDLKSVPNNVPVFVIMHIGTNESKNAPKWQDDIKEHIGYVHPLWSKEKIEAETQKVYANVKDRFYKALQGHNILGIICGHTHGQKVKLTSNGKYNEYVIGRMKNPAFFKYDPVTNKVTVQSINDKGVLGSF